MDYDHEITSLHAETLALQIVLVKVLAQLQTASPELAERIVAGLNDAANQAEDFAIHFGERAAPEHTVKAIRIVEEVRTAIVGDKDKPRRGV
jgi:hypothetical protein